MENNSLIEIKAQIEAPLSLVWRSWTQEQHIQNWNFASSDWHCPKAKNDLKEGGVFSYQMAAKDNSMSFDFKGKYDDIKEFKSIAFHLNDERTVSVEFIQEEDKVWVTETFEAEDINGLELQRQGWQAILDNFKKYTEKLTEMRRLHFEIEINAPKAEVYQKMLDSETYKKWTSVFHPGSFYRGDWKEGGKILFIGCDSEGNEGGMVTRIKKLIPNEIVSMEHYGILDKGVEITEGPEVSPWAGGLEEYKFESINGGTLLKITADTNVEYKEYFENTWPKALATLKSICEN